MSTYIKINVLFDFNSKNSKWNFYGNFADSKMGVKAD